MWLALAIVATVVALLVLGWFRYQSHWDEALFFGDSGDEEFVINLHPQEAAAILWDTPPPLPLDLRSANDFTLGHIPEAVNAPFEIERSEFESEPSLSREQPILVYCDGGYRSRRAIPRLRELGFQRIYHLHRGYLSWRLAGLRTEAGEVKAEPSKWFP